MRAISPSCTVSAAMVCDGRVRTGWNEAAIWARKTRDNKPARDAALERGLRTRADVTISADRLHTLTSYTPEAEGEPVT